MFHMWVWPPALQMMVPERLRQRFHHRKLPVTDTDAVGNFLATRCMGTGWGKNPRWSSYKVFSHINILDPIKRKCSAHFFKFHSLCSSLVWLARANPGQAKDWIRGRVMITPCQEPYKGGFTWWFCHVIHAVGTGARFFQQLWFQRRIVEDIVSRKGLSVQILQEALPQVRNWTSTKVTKVQSLLRNKLIEGNSRSSKFSWKVNCYWTGRGWTCWNVRRTILRHANTL